MLHLKYCVELKFCALRPLENLANSHWELFRNTIAWKLHKRVNGLRTIVGDRSKRVCLRATDSEQPNEAIEQRHFTHGLWSFSKSTPNALTQETTEGQHEHSESANDQSHYARFTTQAKFDEEHGYTERPRPPLVDIVKRHVRET